MRKCYIVLNFIAPKKHLPQKDEYRSADDILLSDIVDVKQRLCNLRAIRVEAVASNGSTFEFAFYGGCAPPVFNF